jgi:hypothetical protein
MKLSNLAVTLIAIAGFVTASAQCTAPALAMFNICSPYNEASVANPIHVSASATPPQGSLTDLQLWVDGTKYMNSTTNTLSGQLPVNLSKGKHRFTYIMTSTSATGARQWNTIIYVNVH